MVTEVACPFPITYLSERRVCANLDDIWEAAYAWCRAQGLKKEHGKFQGAPPI